MVLIPYLSVGGRYSADEGVSTRFLSTVVSALLKQGAQVDLQNNVSNDSFGPILGPLVI